MGSTFSRRPQRGPEVCDLDPRCQALHNPKLGELLEAVDQRLSQGLWKVGQCFEHQLPFRPRGSHYSATYFDRQRGILLAYGLTDTARASQLETAAIQRAKYVLRTGVNAKDRDGVSHDDYCASRPGALYAVPVLTGVAKTQAKFKKIHVSPYKRRQREKALQTKLSDFTEPSAQTKLTDFLRKGSGGSGGDAAAPPATASDSEPEPTESEAMESEATESEATEYEPTESMESEDTESIGTEEEELFMQDNCPSEYEEEDEMTDVEKVEAAQEDAAQTEGEPEQHDGKGGKRKPRTQRSYTEIAKFNSKAEAVNCLQQEGSGYKRYNSSGSPKGCPRGAHYRCVLHKDCPRTIRLWFSRQDEQWHLSESGEHSEAFNITQNRVSPFLKQRLIPLLKKEDGTPAKVLEQLKAEAKESNDTVMQQMLEEVTYKQIAALRKAVLKNLRAQAKSKPDAAPGQAPGPEAEQNPNKRARVAPEQYGW